MQSQYSLRSPSVKRLMKEAHELSEPTEQYYAQPLEDNLFEWHFTIRGPADTEFEGGIYHGRIVLPPDYPMKPPSIILLTSNGRFEIGKKICLSISGHHPESWQPSWSIRTALLAIIGFMPTHGGGAIGSLDYTADERRVLARKSREFKCQSCGPVNSVLLPPTSASEETAKEAKELASQISFQAEKEKTKETQDRNSNAEDGVPAAETTPNLPQQQQPNFPPFPGFLMPGQLPMNLPPNFMFNPAYGPFGGPYQGNPNLVQSPVAGSQSGGAHPTTTDTSNVQTETQPSSTVNSQNESETAVNASAAGATQAGVTNSGENQSVNSGMNQTTTEEPQTPGLRQRRVNSETTSPAVDTNPVTAEIPVRRRVQREAGGTGSLVLMMILAVALAMLVARRVLLSSEWAPQWRD
ncbi:ubiquitin-conjugating enzyme E2 J1 [Lingula anatina]|uniref:Ubiquitin-conjugating enzyme E2 J1 n=1 Tax=Lingula anatina TaxID=7574 RepID=A0A1S3JVE5_LINAN|nr:ubiquitin-conjugating enzyme E2 J1 [Lingula anatina]|eukprot:XP_013414338.1 ubiquitin-conjugating enzyme E2 J1 [Lingula anatina]